jgi:hypothetical protein
VKNFSFNSDGTVSVHYENLNPAGVKELISLLQGTLWARKKESENPIQIMQKSAKLDRARGELSFLLDWNSERLFLDLDDPVIPEPNVRLSEVQHHDYTNLIQNMLSQI